MNTYRNVMNITKKLIINKNWKNRKYVSTPAPKYPSISFNESYQSRTFRIRFRMKRRVLAEQNPMK